MPSNNGWPWLRGCSRLTRLVLPVLVGSMLSLSAAAQTEQRFSVLTQGQAAGELVLTTDAQGGSRVRFSYRDNGRGPDMDEEFSVDAQGAPVSYRVSGKSTFGGQIAETFSRDPASGVARWTSTVDKGEQATPAGALYLPVEFSTAFSAQLMRSLLQRPALRAEAVAGGEFSVEKLAKMSLPSGGEKIDVALFALVGVGTDPFYLWLRDDPEHALFAEVWPGYGLLPQGQEAHFDALLQRQIQAQSERLSRLQQKLARPLSGVTVIRNVRWFDAAAATIRDAADIYLFEGRITAIEAPGSDLRQAAQTVDGRGKTLLPGLFDMHAHAGDSDGLLNLAAGVTSVRDVGNDNEELLRLRRRIDLGEQAGPRIQANGFIEGRSAFSSRTGILVDSLDEAKRAADWYARRGYRQLKLYNSFKPEWVRPLAAYAHARGLRVGGHVPAFMRAEEAVRAGYDELHHINQVMLNFLVSPQDDTRTLLRFTLVGDRAATVALDGARVRDFLALLKHHGTVVDPTASAFESLYLQRNGEPSPSFGMISEHLPVAARRWLKSNSMDVNDANAERYRASYATMLAVIGRMHKAGITLVAGTDNWAGFALHRELELYAQAGIAPAQVLKIATWNAAKVTATLGDRGTIARGQRSDLLLVDGDPSQRIADIRRATLVIKGDLAYAPDKIYEALGVRPFVPSTPVEPVPGADEALKETPGRPKFP